MAELAKCGLLQQSSCLGLGNLGEPAKRVRFHSDHMRSKVRPTHTNLRPLERLMKKASSMPVALTLLGADADGLLVDRAVALLKALRSWDTLWRNYLFRFYSDDMMLRYPATPRSLRELASARNELEVAARECAALGAELPLHAGGGQSSPVNANSFYWKLLLRESEQERVLSRIIEGMCSWLVVEHNRWELACYSDIRAHQVFCEFVDQLETNQKKFKSVADGIKRLRKKAQKERLGATTRSAPTRSFSPLCGIRVS